jgi:subtilase family serine protease
VKRFLISGCFVLSLLVVSLFTPARSFAANTQSVASQHVPVCSSAPVGFAHCNAILVSSRIRASGPSGYNPADLQSAYKLPSSTAGSGQTVAIVDAYNDPNAESDLGVYRSKFGLSPCTTANGCFRKVDQNGGTSYPRGDTGWAEEISLDLDMVSAVCPNCHILLVEAKTNSFANLATAVDTAARLGAKAISNSYGGSEYSSEVSDQSHFNHPGIAITASSGDNGYGVEFPAASQYVTAVGGTSLTRASNSRGWSETVWSGAGSGCSAYISKPSWQHDAGCSRRTVADVSADADPNTGVSVYDTFHTSGWLVFGGTSVASPIIASVYALAGNEGSITYGSYPYSHTSSLFDVTSGSNGSCGGSYLCTATTGYDGPTGLGTPNGAGGF